MKTFGLAVLGAIAGYVIGFSGGILLIETLSSNTHDRSVEAAMTGAFVSGPLMAAVSVVVLWIWRSRRAQSSPRSLRRL